MIALIFSGSNQYQGGVELMRFWREPVEYVGTPPIIEEVARQLIKTIEFGSYREPFSLAAALAAALNSKFKCFTFNYYSK